LALHAVANQILGGLGGEVRLNRVQGDQDVH
jgi:hypothetical protein